MCPGPVDQRSTATQARRNVSVELRSTESSPALVAAIKMLSARRLSRAQLAQRLRDRGYAPDAVTSAIGECERRRFVDDKTYAELYVKGVLDRKAVGRMRLLQELVKRGIDGDLAAEVLDNFDGDEEARIDRALAKLETMRPQDGYAQLGRRLERLGFGAPAIARSLRRRAVARGPLPGAEDFEEHP